MEELSEQVQELLGIQLSVFQIGLLERYEKELIEWNQHMNLTAIREPDQIRVKHFLDSLTCLKIMRDLNNAKVIDIGTGAGFPGLPLKIPIYYQLNQPKNSSHCKYSHSSHIFVIITHI